MQRVLILGASGVSAFLVLGLIAACSRERGVQEAAPIVCGEPPRIEIRVTPLSDDGTSVRFEVLGIPYEIVREMIISGAGKGQRGAAWFQLFVEGNTTPVQGTYEVGESFSFEPCFPLRRGVTYTARFGRPDGKGEDPGQVCTKQFVIPRRMPATRPAVAVMYPTIDDLPENQLKFYLHFSAPMSRGEAYEHIHLRESSGREVEHPFLELDQELWDPSGKRFTLFIDPGRIKRGVKPREEIGPSLEAGKSYTLEIDAGWHDAEGNPLKEAFKKSFRVGPPIDEVVDVKAWKVRSPTAGSRMPLTVTFPRPLDHGMLERVLTVTTLDHQTVAGTIAISEKETVWQFTPHEAWKAGACELVIDTELEDLAGNNIAKPFEVDVFHPVQREVKTKTVTLPFTVK